MAILEKELITNISSRNITHLKSKGYNVKVGDTIIVKIDDFKKTSGVRVTKVCDICGKHTANQQYGSITKQRETGDGIDRCITCFGLVIGERKSKHFKYENSAEYFCKQNGLENILSLYSDKNEKPLSKISRGSNVGLIWNCSIHGDKHEHTVPMGKKIRGMSTSTQGCTYCSGRLINETNCVATTHPHIAEKLWNKEDGYKYSFSASAIVAFKCTDCGKKIGEKKINQVSYKGITCPYCSDGMSYPEKLMFYVLNQLAVKFKMQKTFAWSQKRRYDFYLRESNIIIEVHGDQHYGRSFESVGGRTLEEEKVNDLLKEKLAKDNGVGNYIVIDARSPDFSHIRKSIEDSHMGKMFDLSSVNFEECSEKSQSSLVKIVCNKWNENKNVQKTAKVLNVSESTVKKYLRRGVEIGWCNYNGEENTLRKVVQVNDDGKVVAEHKSLTSAGLLVNTDAGNIYAACKGTIKSARGFRWFFKEDYDDLIKNNVEIGKAKTKPSHVIQMTIEGEVLNTFISAHTAAKSIGIQKQANIDKCCRGERLTAYGFKWKYEEIT